LVNILRFSLFTFQPWLIFTGRQLKLSVFLFEGDILHIRGKKIYFDKIAGNSTMPAVHLNESFCMKPNKQ
jgi:hypothetical protein